jgi:hypothetical protein
MTSVWRVSPNQFHDISAKLIEFLLELRHPFELDVQFVIDAVDLLLNFLEQLPTPCRFAALWSAGASFPTCALDATRAGYTSRPAQSPVSDGPARADRSDITFKPRGPAGPGGPGGPGMFSEPPSPCSRFFFAIAPLV